MVTTVPLSPPSHAAPLAPPMSPGLESDLSFDNYCIVCDRLIIPPKEKEVEQVTKPKKKAAGTIRVKNPDGTTTTRTAAGAKVTRPGLKRNPNSANRLAAVAAGNAAARLQPLTRSKTADPTPTYEQTPSSPSSPSPPSQPQPAPSHSSAFRSAIYCSMECAQTDAGRSDRAYKEIQRTMSYDFTQGYPLERIVTSGLPGSDRSNYAPPSPLFISGSDTESSNAGGPDSGPACSAPKTLGYFRIGREGPDEAWHDVNRQRRSSMHPPTAIRPTSLSRQMSSQSGAQHGWGDVSSDSLSSLWNTATEAELNIARSVSGGAKRRSTSSTENPLTAASQRSTSISSDRSAITPARPIARSNLSQTSLASSPRTGQTLPAEFGSAPNHTLSLLTSYAAAFPVRDASGSSSSYTQKGFLSGSVTPDSRRGSINGMQRPVNGTIRAKSRQGASAEATWDSYGRGEVEAINARNAARAAMSHDHDHADHTPKQSFEKDHGRWRVKYINPGAVPRTTRARSTSSKASERSHRSGDSESAEADRTPGLAIPVRPRLGASVTSSGHSRTPQPGKGMAIPGTSLPVRSASASPHIPDLAALRVGSGGCAPYLTSENVAAQKNGFNWEGHEKKGGMVYELPKGIKIDRSKAGLFYFN